MENSKNHILIVDDDDRIRNLLKDYLSENWLVHTVVLLLTQASIFGEIPDPDIFDGAIISKSNHKSDRTLESNSSNSQEESEERKSEMFEMRVMRLPCRVSRRCRSRRASAQCRCESECEE